MVNCLSCVRVTEIAAMTGTNYCAVLTGSGHVYLWPWLDDRDGVLITVVADLDVVHIRCGDEYGSVIFVIFIRHSLIIHLIN